MYFYNRPIMQIVWEKRGNQEATDRITKAMMLNTKASIHSLQKKNCNNVQNVLEKACVFQTQSGAAGQASSNFPRKNCRPRACCFCNHNNPTKSCGSEIYKCMAANAPPAFGWSITDLLGT